MSKDEEKIEEIVCTPQRRRQLYEIELTSRIFVEIEGTVDEVDAVIENVAEGSERALDDLFHDAAEIGPANVVIDARKIASYGKDAKKFRIQTSTGFERLIEVKSWDDPYKA